jgi:glycosyltransferase involved in cell wall biosynthesis
MSDIMVELTILMPCFNEAETLETCIAKASSFLERHGINGEILIADNGSTDGSQKIAARCGARVVHVRERGYGAALIEGMRAARGEYLVMGDADNSYDFSELSLFLKQLRAGDELVIGNRFRGGIKPGAMPFLHRYLGNPLLSWLGRLFYGVPIGDFHCGLRGFSRNAILRLGLQSPGMEFASEMIVKAKLWNLKMSEVPTTLSPDGRSRAPHLRTWPDGWRHLRFLVLHSPKWLFFYPGVALLCIGLSGVAILLPGPLQVFHNIVLDTNTLLAASFAVLIGVQLVAFSVLARRYAASEGFLPPVYRLPSVVTSATLERMLLVALGFLLLGGTAIGWAVWYWASLDFGSIADTRVMRTLTVGLLLVAISVQIAAGTFLASIFEIRRR